MSKILILANDYKTLANFRMELLRKLLAEGHQVVLSLPSDHRNSVFLDMGCELIETPISRHGTNPIKELKLILTYKKQIKTVKPDCVLTFTVKPNIYGSIAAASLRVPYINNVTGLGSVMQSESIMKKIMLRLQKYAYRKSSCVFFQNKGNLEYFRSRNIAGEQGRLLPGSGVNLELHQFSDYPREAPYVDFVIVSRLRRDKGYDELFSAIDQLLPLYPKIRFHIVGWIEEEQYRAVLNRYQDNERVIYHGEITQHQVHEVIRNCHCLIHPSYHEGMANVVMEAAAAGRPCLVSDIHGCKEGVDEGETGYCFKVADASSLQATIKRFLTESAETHRKMGQAARIKMEKEFDRNIVINKYLEQINCVTTSKAEEL